MAAGRVVQDFLMILDPRLMRTEIAHAHICDKLPLVGNDPAPLDPAAHTITELTKWSGVWIFFAPDPWLNFLTRFRRRNTAHRMNRVLKNGPPFYGLGRKRRPRRLVSPGNVLIPRHDSDKEIFPLSESRVEKKTDPHFTDPKENGGPAD